MRDGESEEAEGIGEGGRTENRRKGMEGENGRGH